MAKIMAESPEGREWQPGKATEFDDAMEGRTLKPGELWPERPQLRLRPDVPSVEVSEHTRVQDVLGRLKNGDVGSLALRDPSGNVTAMVVPVEQYVELAGAAIEGDDQFEVTLERSIVASPTALAALHIEQVDQQARWDAGSRRYS
jgi:hypothetical protein